MITVQRLEPFNFLIMVQRPIGTAACFGFSVPLGQWHNTECLESGTVFIECKDGAYEPLGEEDVRK